MENQDDAKMKRLRVGQQLLGRSKRSLAVNMAVGQVVRGDGGVTGCSGQPQGNCGTYLKGDAMTIGPSGWRRSGVAEWPSARLGFLALPTP